MTVSLSSWVSHLYLVLVCVYPDKHQWENVPSQPATTTEPLGEADPTFSSSTTSRLGGKQNKSSTGPVVTESWTGTESWETQVTSPPLPDKGTEEVGGLEGVRVFVLGRERNMFARSTCLIVCSFAVQLLVL